MRSRCQLHSAGVALEEGSEAAVNRGIQVQQGGPRRTGKGRGVKSKSTSGGAAGPFTVVLKGTRANKVS